MAEVHGGSEALGWVCIAISTLFFGSNFVPVKRYETHDGMFFQWVMCAAIFLVGLFVQFTLFTFPELVPTDGHWEGGNQTTRHWVPNGTDSGRPNGAGVTFMPLATVGGVLWATGNTLSVPVINSIGFGLGQLIWNSANMLMGWASGKFGLFIGPEYADDITYPNLNYAGVALALAALCMYPFIKVTEDGDTDGHGSSSRAQIKSSSDSLIGVTGGDALLEIGPAVDPLAEIDRAGRTRTAASKKLAGVGMAIVAGLFFGNAFTPSDYLRDHALGPSAPTDYIFSQFVGIFATSTCWFIVYCIYMRGSPLINPRLVLPAFVSGAMWAIAQAAWFISNATLQKSVAFPFTTSGPGIVCALWGVFVFGEIRGCRNYLFLSAAITLAVVGCTLIGLSTSAPPGNATKVAGLIF